MQTEYQLPTKPSELIRLALSDLRAIEQDPRYRVDMEHLWHSRAYSSCTVCLAGAVMANHLSADANLGYLPSDFPRNACALCAIDDFRLGNVGSGCGRMEVDTKLSSRTITDYELDRKGFFCDMEELANDLEDEGN